MVTAWAAAFAFESAILVTVGVSVLANFDHAVECGRDFATSAHTVQNLLALLLILHLPARVESLNGRARHSVLGFSQLAKPDG